MLAPTVRRLSVVSSLASLAALAACVGPAAEDGGASADAFVETRVFAGPELVSCAVEAGSSSSGGFYASHVVRCASAIPAGFPLRLAGIVSVTDKNGNVTSAQLEALSASPLSAEIFDDRFPVKVKLDAYASSDGESTVVNLSLPSTLSAEGTLTTTGAAPFSAKLPFDVWPITYVAREVTVVGSVDGGAIPLGPMTSHGAPTLGAKRSSLVVEQGKTVQHLYAVAPGGTLSGTADFGGASHAFSIDAPGTYAALADGLHVVQADAPKPAGGPAFGGCSAQPSGADVALQCSIFDEHDGIVVTEATATYSADGAAGAPVSIPLTLPKDAVVATIPSGDTRGEVVTSLRFAPKIAGVPKSIAETPLSIRLPVADIVATQKNAFALPFDSWPVTIIADEGFFAYVTVAPHLVTMSRAWGDFTSFTTEEAFLDVQAGETATFFLAADASADALDASVLVAGIQGGEADHAVRLQKGRTYKATLAGVEEIAGAKEIATTP